MDDQENQEIIKAIASTGNLRQQQADLEMEEEEDVDENDEEDIAESPPIEPQSENICEKQQLQYGIDEPTFVDQQHTHA